ncbi:MAG: hypothetical protein ACFFAH_15605 [Promethearchaeota archaeon]
MKSLADKHIEIDNTMIYLTLFKLHKSYLLLISDQKDMGIGSVTLASPPLVEGLKSTAASYNLFGVDQKLLSTIISEKASKILKAPVLLLLFLKIKKKEEEIAKELMKFLNKVLTDIVEK